MKDSLRRPRRLGGWLGAGALAAALPLALIAPEAGLISAAPGTGSSRPPAAPQGRYWSGLWMGTGSDVDGVTLRDVRKIINANSGAAASLTGEGIGVAMIDTGIAPVPGLPQERIVNGPDLSFESQSPNLRYLDTYGHGTHMAGIIVGNERATGTVGLAPKAKLTSIKVGTSNGAVDVTQVIAAVDWVVENRNHDPANPIRVINLSYGSGGTAPYWNDPLQFAVEQAWFNGIIVVVAGGNNGNDTRRLTNPATDPFAISVGATSTENTIATSDDGLAAFTNQARQGKGLEVLAPGTSITSLRNPGSNIDETYASARVGKTLFKGSGSSQAAAITSAAAALLLQGRPSLTPDQVKKLLEETGPAVLGGAAAERDYRQVDVNAALAADAPTWKNRKRKSKGDGKVQNARGRSVVVRDNVALTGERTPFGPFDSATWAAKAARKSTWTGGTWLGSRLAGDGWTGTSSASKTWGSATWAGNSWAGSAWVDPDWSGRYWSGRYWSGRYWSGRYWSSQDWSTAYWG